MWMLAVVVGWSLAAAAPATVEREPDLSPTALQLSVGGGPGLFDNHAQEAVGTYVVVRLEGRLSDSWWRRHFVLGLDVDTTSWSAPGQAMNYSIGATPNGRWEFLVGYVRPWIGTGFGFRTAWSPGSSSQSALRLEADTSVGIDVHPAGKLVVGLGVVAHAPTGAPYVGFFSSAIRVGTAF